MAKKEPGIKAFLQKLDFSSLGLSDQIVQDAFGAEKAFSALGEIKQKLLEKDRNELTKQFDKLLEKEIKKRPREKTLFPNHVPADGFGISSVISDPHTKMLDLHEEDLTRCYDDGTIVRITFGNQKQVVLGHQAVQPGYFTGTHQDFLEIISQWVNPRIIQHWCCCWNWACQNQSFVFPYVPINDILATVYARPKSGNFCMRDRRAFSASLDFLHNATIEVPVTVTSIKKGKKKTEQATKLFRLFNLNLAKKNKKGDVYLKIAGELLPELNPGRYRGRVFSKGIFKLNPNREGNRILLAYRIGNRLDQMNGEPIKWHVEELIKAAGLGVTYESHKSDGCRKLTKHLERLVDVKCIGGFEPKKISATLIKPVVIYSNP